MSDHQPIKPIKQEVRGGARGRTMEGGESRCLLGEKINRSIATLFSGKESFESACAEREMGGNARQRQADTRLSVASREVLPSGSKR